MKYKEILDGIVSIENKAANIEQDIKAYSLESEPLKEKFDELFEKIGEIREPLFDLVHSGRIDK